MTTNKTSSLPFRFDMPFQTRCGWPARLVGVLHRNAFPLVVAVMESPGEERLECYTPQGTVMNNPSGAPTICDLVNIEPDWDNLPTGAEFVEAHVTELSSIPAGDNPFHHDHDSMGTDLVRGWLAMHDGSNFKGEPRALDRIDLVNQRSGQRLRVNLRTLKITVKE